jgi:hypothetical protein
VSGREVLRDVYVRAIEHTLADPNFRWLIVWPHESAEFATAVHRTVALRYSANEQAYAAPMPVYEATATPEPDEDTRSCEVAPATEEEIDLFVRAIGARYPRPYSEAHDFVPERVHVTDAAHAWHAAGLARERGFLVARKGGRPVAIAVLESASEGLQLFGLLDLARLFPLAEGGERSFGALLGAARAWYRARGKTRYVYAAEGEGPAPPLVVAGGLRSMGGAELTVLPRELVPELLETVYDLTAPKSGKRT